MYRRRSLPPYPAKNAGGKTASGTEIDRRLKKSVSVGFAGIGGSFFTLPPLDAKRKPAP